MVRDELMNPDNSKISDQTIIILDKKKKPSEIKAEDLTYVTGAEAMEGQCANIQYADTCTPEHGMADLIVAVLCSILLCTEGYPILSGPYFIDETMYCKIRAKRFKHRGYHCLFDQFPGEGVGLGSFNPFCSTLLDL